MSYIQTATRSESTTSRGPSAQSPKAGHPNEKIAIDNLLNHFATLGLGAGGPSPTVPISAQMFYTPDGQLVYAPSMYPAPALATTPGPDTSFSHYSPALPYLAPAGYHGYLPTYQSTMPYTPGRGFFPDRSDHLSREVPELENRRGSYSTNESAPGTPYYGSFNQHQTTHIVDRSPLGSTPSPQQYALQHVAMQGVKYLPYKKIPVDVDIDALIKQAPAIPLAVPAVWTPKENMRTLDQSLANPIPGNHNVYIRGLHPNTDDETLAAYAARFGRVETSKAIIDTSTGACKGFGFAKYFDVRHSELCIRGFWELGYEVGFARESFNARLKAEGDHGSTNLYVSNLPKNMTEAELGAIFMDYIVSSSRILRDHQNNSRGVGFARFESREVCEEIIKKFHGQPIGEEGLLLQVRYADTPAQKDLKRITTERRQFRAQEYNVGAYGVSAVSSSIPPRAGHRTSAVQQQLSDKMNRSWKRQASGNSPNPFKDIDHGHIKLDITAASPEVQLERVSSSTPSISDDGDDTIVCKSPVVVHGNSPTARMA